MLLVFVNVCGLLLLLLCCCGAAVMWRWCFLLVVLMWLVVGVCWLFLTLRVVAVAVWRCCSLAFVFPLLCGVALLLLVLSTVAACWC